MKQFFKIIHLLLLLGLGILTANAQKYDCLPTDNSQKNLYLNGDNFRLIDNALRCFKLNSIAEMQDSIVRIWILEDVLPDTPRTWSVKMFEFGKKAAVPFAMLHTLQWGYEPGDSSLPVKCIKHEKIIPESGWLAFEKDIRRLDLLKLYKKPLINTGLIIVDYGMLITQFLFGHTTHTVDFTGLIGLPERKDIPNIDNATRMLYLLFYIEKHFLIRLPVGPNEYNFRNEIHKRLKPDK